jgi:predicted negative regulator of RcsB-dependent stress response
LTAWPTQIIDAIVGLGRSLMATYDLEEQEQIAELKAWWKQYGNLVTGIITAAALAALAWQGWNWYERQQAAQAAVVFASLQKAIASNDAQRIKAASGELADKYGRHGLCATGCAEDRAVLVDAGDVKTARVQFAWVVEHGKDELRDVARLRLAALMLDEKAYDEALKLLEGAGCRIRRRASPTPVAMSSPRRARQARRGRRTRLPWPNSMRRPAVAREGTRCRTGQANAAYRESLQLKLDALGEPG